MKRFFSALAIGGAVATACSSAAIAADGTITFNGRVTDQTCTISTPAGTDFSVTLPTVSQSALSSAGETAARTLFAINLTNCSAGSTMATYFEPGPNVDIASGRLINQADVADRAENVQLQLLGDNFQFLPIRAVGGSGAQDNSQWVPADGAGAADLNYYVEYYATAAVTSGEVTSSVQYTIIYQ